MHAYIHTYIDLYMFIGLHIYRVLWLIFIFSAENFPHFTLHSAKIFRTTFSAFYPLAIFRIPQFTLTRVKDKTLVDVYVLDINPFLYS